LRASAKGVGLQHKCTDSALPLVVEPASGGGTGLTQEILVLWGTGEELYVSRLLEGGLGAQLLLPPSPPSPD